MRLHLVQNTTVEFDRFATEWNNLSIKIDEITTSRDYGNVIDVMYIGIICVNPAFDFLFKTREPRYFKKPLRSTPGDLPLNAESRLFEVEIKFDFHAMMRADTSSSEVMILRSLIDLIPVIHTFNALKAFDAVQFESDIKLLGGRESPVWS